MDIIYYNINQITNLKHKTMDKAMLLIFSMVFTEQLMELLKKQNPGKESFTIDEVLKAAADASFELINRFNKFEEEKEIEKVNLPKDLLN